MSRLHLKYGFVAEQDRLSSSADALSVTEPATGSKSRTKGNLYLIVASSIMGGRSRDATAMVADTIRREYYYDESAGIPICLQKAFRSADRRLRGREGHGAAPGSIGVALAVIRGGELYVATAGPVDAYLVRAARLLMPEHQPGAGLPAGDGLRVDVWRGDFAVGDSLLLVSRDLTEVVGTEELKNAVVTLHPQSAVEHLHHLFVASGGEGSDAVLAIESSEASAPRAENRLVPVAAAQESDARGMTALTGGAVASTMAGRAMGARETVGNAVASLSERVADLIPGRRRQYRRITPHVSQRESQRRAAVAFLAFLGVLLVLGLVVAFLPRGSETPVRRVNAGEAAFTSAQGLVQQALDDDLITDDPERALVLLRQAWEEVDSAGETGVPASRVAPLRDRIAGGLDRLYGTHRMAGTVLARIEGAGPHDPRDLVAGPDGAAYVLDRETRTVSRVDPVSGAAAVIVTAGDGSGEGIGTPMMLATGGPDLLIADIRGGLWRWRPSDEVGNGTLGPLIVAGDVEWGDDVVDIGTFLLAGEAEAYNLYVADPSSDQILRYQPTGDGSGFSAPTDYLAADTEDVSSFRQMYIDGDIYALTAESAVRHESGQRRDFELAPPPDGTDLRPGKDYRYFDGVGLRREGRLYVWDAEHGRLVVFEKETGAYVEQWIPAKGSPPLSDLRGIYVVQPETPPVPEDTEPVVAPPTVYWLTVDALIRAELVDAPDRPAASPSPGGPGVSPPPDDEPAASPERTRRPRRSPRPAP